MEHKNKKTAGIIIIVGILIVGAVFVLFRGRNGNTPVTAEVGTKKAEAVNVLDVDGIGERKAKKDDREEQKHRDISGNLLEPDKIYPLEAEIMEDVDGNLPEPDQLSPSEEETPKEGALEEPGTQSRETGRQNGEMNDQAAGNQVAGSALEYKALPAMSIISESLSAEQVQGLFYAEPVSGKLAQRITGKTYVENDNISLEDLRYVRILYRGFDEETHVGELVVNQKIADKMVSIFKELYENNYQLERVVLIDDYDADDDASVAANNTSAFNYRVVEGTKKLSKHSYGLAIDINPLYNPYVTKKTGDWGTKLEGCQPYIDRSQDFPHKIDESDLCYQLFKKNGFTWGGDWSSVKDYQHFEYPL